MTVGVMRFLTKTRWFYKEEEEFLRNVELINSQLNKQAPNVKLWLIKPPIIVLLSILQLGGCKTTHKQRQGLLIRLLLTII